jgi:hypothetical protein
MSDQSARGSAGSRADGRATHSTGSKTANDGARARAVCGTLALGRIARTQNKCAQQNDGTNCEKLLVHK